METKITSHIIKGAIIALVMIAWVLLSDKMGVPINGSVQYLPYALLIIGIIISCILYAKQMSGAVKFAEVFANGFKTVTIVALIMAIFTFITVKYVYAKPTVVEIAAQAKILEKQYSVMPNEAMEMAAESVKRQWIVFVSSAIFTSLISGVVGAALGAALAKKN